MEFTYKLVKIYFREGIWKIKFRRSKMLKLIIFTIITIFVTLDAQAYIGPGAGIGAILTGLGFILLVILLIVSILIYPFK